MTELESQEAVQFSSISAKNFLDSNEFSSRTIDSEKLKDLSTNLLNAVAEVNKWKRVIVS